MKLKTEVEDFSESVILGAREYNIQETRINYN